MPEKISSQPEPRPPVLETFRVFVLVEKIPSTPVDGVKQVVNCHHELGYWRNEIHAKQIADRKSLHVQELIHGEVLT